MVLDGIKVLDFSRFAAGPVCAEILADMGAEVIRIEKSGGEDDRTLPPLAPDGTGLMFTCLARHKKSITLNLNNDRGKEILKELVKKADVVIHNFTQGSPEAKLLDYGELKKINPAIIVAAISAFGQSGPHRHWNGFDGIAQAMSGSMSFTGFPGNPPTRAGIGAVDWFTGSTSALGIMFALYHRTKTGEGQMIDISLLDSAVYLMAGLGIAADYQVNNAVRRQLGNQVWYQSCSNCFKAKDGWVVIGAAVDVLWRRLAKTMGKPELADDPRFKDCLSRFNNRDIVNSIVGEWVAERTTAEVVEQLQSAYVPAGPVLSVDKVVNEPCVKAREMLVNIKSPGGTTILGPGFPVKFSATPANIDGVAPGIGEYNDEIYGDLLGFSKEQVAQLESEGVI